MTNPFKSYRQIHCIGIGGTGVSGLARILKQSGSKVLGSDEKKSKITDQLIKEGITVKIGHKAANLNSQTDLVIYSAAIPENNPERIEAKKRGLLQLTYPQAVGLLTKFFETVCISGTHGKTTTTAMAAAAFIAAKKDPTVIVGASIKELHSRNERLGKGPNFILESCEYRRGFLNYHPQIIIITNIEADHLDYYKNLKDYISAFKEFIAKLPKSGLLIANFDDSNVRKICEDYQKQNPKSAKVISFGKSQDANYQLKSNSIFQKVVGKKSGRVKKIQTKKIANLNLQIPGDHNLMNATAAISLCSELGLNLKLATAAINNYTGASRRFEIKGKVGKTTIIDDYAHHPTEIRATLKAVRQKFGKEAKVLCVFQPHQYSRTRELLKEFATSFQDANELIVPNILRVRDTAKDVASISPEILIAKISKNHPNAHHIPGFEKTIKNIHPRIKDFNVIITLGAGDIWQISQNLANRPKPGESQKI